MVWHMQKRWCLRFRRDPDAGRVLFIGPLVVSLDVSARPRSASAQAAAAGSGCPPTTPTAGTDAQRRREKERSMGGIL